jgi:hypothetical protein
VNLDWQVFRYVTSNLRLYAAVRLEVVQSARNFISKRLNVEEDGTIQLTKNIVESQTCNDLVQTTGEALKLLVTEKELSAQQQQLVSDCCNFWPDIQSIPILSDSADYGTKYSVRLRQMFSKTSGVLQWLLGSFLVVTPQHGHRACCSLSHHNKVKSIFRSSLGNDTVNDRLIISTNGTGTASYDPRPAVAEFLKKKSRRYREPDNELYTQRDFVAKFFRQNCSL